MNQQTTQLIERRNKAMGPAYRLHYPNAPLHPERAEGVWIYDVNGQKYLDTYNNVPHVGHCHPKVVEAVCQQVAQFNSHTRYLHHTVVDYSERLLDTVEEELDTCHFGCSGTEANELALRLARKHTGNQGVIVAECAYHGHSQAIYEISSRDVPADQLPDYVVTVPSPDTLRGIHNGEDAAEQYLKYVEAAIETLKERGHGAAAMIIDTVGSAAGTVIPPQGYFQKAAELVRKAGGLFIADEVQAGFARMGDNFWVYQGHNVVPDFVTMGKPIGNGMPMGVCITRREFVEDFAKTNKYFNTFAGIPVTAAAGIAVLDVLEEEQLQQNAWTVGEHIKKHLQNMSDKHQCIGDIRGSGFFIGLDLVTCRDTLAPATEFAAQVVYAMKERGVLSGAIGPDMNILKLRPPMSFTTDHADQMLNTIEDSLNVLK